MRLPSVPDKLEHAELLLRIVEAVQALPEFYREVILKRSWEDLAPSQIAASLDDPRDPAGTLKIETKMADLRPLRNGFVHLLWKGASELEAKVSLNCLSIEEATRRGVIHDRETTLKRVILTP